MRTVAPPEKIAWLVDAVGDDATLQFIESTGGRRVWVPTRAHGSEMERLYGEQIAAAVSAERGGLHWDVPVCREWRALVLYARGLSANDIAMRVGCSRSSVIRILGGRTPRLIAARDEARADTRQFGLFA